MGQSANQVTTGQQDDPEVIAADIARTRADMSETIDAIQQRLSPDTLTEQAKEKVEDLTEHAKAAAREAVEEAKTAVREATIGRVETMVRQASDTAYDTREGLMATVRQNPIPAALVGIGLGWLWMNRRSGSSHRDTRHYDARYEARYEAPYGGRYGDERRGYYAEGYGRSGYGYPASGGQSQGVVSQAAGRVGEAAGGVANTVGSAASTVGETVGNVASTVGETVGNVAGTVGDTAGNLVGGAQELAGNLVGGAQSGAQRAEDRLGRAIQENPLAVGAVALAVGAAVGLALPQTERENQLMGEARDSLVERAQEVAGETVEKVQHVATEAQQSVTQTVKEEAKQQGLTS